MLGLAVRGHCDARHPAWDRPSPKSESNKSPKLGQFERFLGLWYELTALKSMVLGSCPLGS